MERTPKRQRLLSITICSRRLSYLLSRRVHFITCRIAQVLQDLNAGMIITDTSNYSRSVEIAASQCDVLNIEHLDSTLSTANPGISKNPDSLANIYFTSGSTGRAKGVMNNQRNVLHNIMRYTNNLHINKADRLTLIQFPCFSGSMSNVFGALLNSASVFRSTCERKV